MKQNKSIKSYVGQLVRMVHESEKKYETQKRKGGTTTGIQNVKKHDLPQQKSTNLFLIAEPEWISQNFPLKKILSIETHGTGSSQKQLAMPQRTGKFVRICFFLRGKAKLIVMTMFKLCRMYKYIFIYIYKINQRKLICDLSPPKTKNNVPLCLHNGKIMNDVAVLGTYRAKKQPL